jgi:hypothetical protein
MPSSVAAVANDDAKIVTVVGSPVRATWRTLLQAFPQNPYAAANQALRKWPLRGLLQPLQGRGGVVEHLHYQPLA